MVFSVIGIGICQKDNVRLIPTNKNMHMLVTIKKDFINFSPILYIHMKYVVNQAIKILMFFYYYKTFIDSFWF